MGLKYSCYIYECDTHKYGCAHKVHQLSCTGVGASEVSVHGSDQLDGWNVHLTFTAWISLRGLVAQTWAALNYFGHDGYAKMAQSIVEASLLLRSEF